VLIVKYKGNRVWQVDPSTRGDGGSYLATNAVADVPE